MKLSCGEHEEHTSLRTSIWLDYGTGMMAMYKTDWENVGGKIRMYSLALFHIMVKTTCIVLAISDRLLV